MKPIAVVAVVCAGFAAGLIGGPERAALRVDAQGPLRVDPSTAGVIAGQVRFVGALTMPKRLNMSANPYCAKVNANDVPSDSAMLVDQKNGLANVFVYIKDGLDPSYSFEPPEAPVVLDQRRCQFNPRVVGVQVGQPLVIVNSDDTLHNVHGRPKVNQQFNNGQPIAGMHMTRMFASPEVMIPLTSDLHSWMAAFVGVVPHPFFAVTGADGSFTIRGVPSGAYTVAAWHEMSLSTATEQITVDAGQTTSVSFTLPPRRLH